MDGIVRNKVLKHVGQYAVDISISELTNSSKHKCMKSSNMPLTWMNKNSWAQSRTSLYQVGLHTNITVPAISEITQRQDSDHE